MKGNGYTVRFSPDTIDEMCGELSSNPHRNSSGDLIEALHCAQVHYSYGTRSENWYIYVTNTLKNYT